MTTEMPPTLGLVLAGGLARRMGGGDKIMLTIGGVKILDRVLERMRPQCSDLILNANGDPARFAATGARGGSRTMCRILSGRWPACSRDSIGRRNMRRASATW